MATSEILGEMQFSGYPDLWDIKKRHTKAYQIAGYDADASFNGLF